MGTQFSLKGMVCLLVLFPITYVRCQTTAVGARSGSLAGVSSVQEDLWAVANNPAGLGGYRHLSAATTAGQRFLMKELGSYAVALSVPEGNGSLGFFAMFSGYRSYIDQKLSLCYGRQFGDRLLFGTSLVYIYQKASRDAASIHQVSYEIGTIIFLSKKVKLAFTTFNPFQLYYKNQTYASLPSIFKLGLSVEYSPSLFIYTECEKDLDFSPVLKIGIEYIYRELFFIRGGIRIFPASWSFGAGLIHDHLLFEFCSSWHQYLGFTPMISLQYNLK
jgi:hypothetical protein